MSLTQSIYVDAPVEKVFEFMKDPRNWQEKGVVYTDVHVTGEGVGTYYGWTFRIPGGLRVEGFDVLTEVVPNKRITERSSWSFVGTP